MLNNPAYYEELIDAKSNIFSQQFDEFVTVYKAYNKKQNEINKTRFDSSVNLLKSSSQDFFNIVKDIKENIYELDSYVIGLGDDVSELNSGNKTLSEMVQHIINLKNGSNTMISDTKTEYNYQYYKNVQLFVGIVAIIMLSAKIFRSDK
jgi:hypothetical protein